VVTPDATHFSNDDSFDNDLESSNALWMDESEWGSFSPIFMQSLAGSTTRGSLLSLPKSSGEDLSSTWECVSSHSLVSLHMGIVTSAAAPTYPSTIFVLEQVGLLTSSKTEPWLSLPADQVEAAMLHKLFAEFSIPAVPLEAMVVILQIACGTGQHPQYIYPTLPPLYCPN